MLDNIELNLIFYYVLTRFPDNNVIEGDLATTEGAQNICKVLAIQILIVKSIVIATILGYQK